MTKKKPQKKKTSNYSKISIAIALLVMVGATVTFAAKYLQYQNQKKQLSIIESDINSLRIELSKSLPEYTIGLDKYCDNYDEVFSKGPLHCDIELKITSPLGTMQVDRINESIHKTKEWTEKISPNVEMFPYKSGIYLNNKTGSECIASFSNHENAKLDGQIFNYRFLCSELSSNSFYPYRSN